MDAQKLRSEVEWLVVERLRDRVTHVSVKLRDNDSLLAVGAISREGWKHAVGIQGEMLSETAEKIADYACDQLLTWFEEKKAAEAVQGDD